MKDDGHEERASAAAYAAETEWLESRQSKAKIAAKVFSPTRATRNLADEPLTADDWRKVYEARKAFVAAIRQIVFEARCRKEKT